MLIREPKEDPARSKEVKVKIPVTHHIKLHSMKVLTGKQISDAITEALDAYFTSRAYEETMHKSGLTLAPFAPAHPPAVAEEDEA
jgi:hypothetical protein